MKLMWLGYLVYNLRNCVMKLCIETGLKVILNWSFMTQFSIQLYFGNSAEEFHPYKTLYFHATSIISFFINIVSYQHI